MSYVKLDLPPGVYRNGTDYQATGRWHDSNMMRWCENTMRPIGGWEYVNDQFLDGPGRGVIAWRTNGNLPMAAIGTPNSLWRFDGDTLVNMTPVGFPPGNINTLVGVGYGSGDYGVGIYGASTAGATSRATTWALDTFGENLIACASHSRTIYQWLPSTPGVLPTALAGAPAASSVFVTPERMVVALGAGIDPRLVMWSDQENATDWIPSALNQAGDLKIQTNGILMAGCRVRGQSLILSSADAWTMRYIGPQLVYSFQQAGDDCGLIGPLAVQPVLGGAFWMGLNNFYQFDGTSVKIVQCDLVDWVFSDINLDERSKINCGHNSAFNEVYFWWCSKGSTEIDRCAVYNYVENHWAPHRTPFLRSCWADSDVFDWPLAASDSGRVYYHEKGWTANGFDRTSQIFAQTGPVEIGNGDKVMMVRQVLPDEVTPGAWKISFGARFTPEDVLTMQGPLPLTPYTDARLTGRQMAIQIEAAVDGDTRVGMFRVDVQPSSGR